MNKTNFSEFQFGIKNDFNNFITNLSDKKLFALVTSVIPLQFSKFLSNENVQKYFFLLNIEDKKQYLYKVFNDPTSLYTIAKLQTEKDLNDFVTTNMTRQYTQKLAKLILVNSNMILLQRFLKVIPVADMKVIILNKKPEFQSILLRLSNQQLFPMFKESFEFFDYTCIL